MNSISGKKWLESKIHKNILEKIKQNFNFSEIISKIIISRNFGEKEIYLIENFLQIPNIFKDNNDYKKAIEIILYSIKNKEKICILGDYDVDGSAATALLVRFLKYINHPYFFYIPDREKDGYGASKKLFTKLVLKKPHLIIMVDCGSTSNEAIDYLNSKKIKSIIIDHHEIYKPYPNANIILNPKKNNGYEKYNYLCATTLTYFFIVHLSKKMKSEFKIKDYLLYVLFATICDVMPLRNLNRLIAIETLRDFKIDTFFFLKTIYDIMNIKSKITINQIGYLIGPILNSGGRLNKSNYATELLVSDNDEFILKRTNQLIVLNEKRKKIEENILRNINFTKIAKQNKDVVIYYDPSINEGLIGIIAARLKDYFDKPSIVITNSNNILKGSARSINNFNIGSIISKAKNLNIIISGGGHNMAAGFTLNKKMLNTFNIFMEKSYRKLKIHNDNTQFYTSKISSIAFNKDFYNDLSKLEPFGNGNPEPIFLLENLKIIKKSIINKKHISCILKSKIGNSINSISFNSADTIIGEYLLNYKKEIKVIGKINENIWNNKKSLQLIIKDLII
jgi:single-stranded-DNA-specific exonuclease